jgi:hypothetical protein
MCGHGTQGCALIPLLFRQRACQSLRIAHSDQGTRPELPIGRDTFQVNVSQGIEAPAVELRALCLPRRPDLP